MRLLLDEMLSAKIAWRLREHGLDVEAVVERRELIGGPDEALLEVAAGEARALVTKNIVDFGPLAHQWAAGGRLHGGLIFLSTKTSPEGREWIGAVTAALISAHEHRALPGAGDVVWLSRPA